MRFIEIKFILLLFLSAMVLEGCNDPKDTGCIYNDPRLCDQAYLDSINKGDINMIDTIAFNENLSNYDEKILLEEFTGFRCVNCPPAAVTAANLHDEYPGRVVLSAIHCTEFFAAPIPPNGDPAGEYQIDLRTPEGEELHDYYNMNGGLPDGMINRLGTSAPPSTIPYQQWADRVAELITQNNPDVFIQVSDLAVNADSTKLLVEVVIKPLNLIPQEEYYINAMLLESGIIAGQKSTSGDIHNYNHKHVFRRASNGAFGTFAYHGDLNLDANTALIFRLPISLEPEWVLENCDVIVAVTKESTREVIQVDEKAITD